MEGRDKRHESASDNHKKKKGKRPVSDGESTDTVDHNLHRAKKIRKVDFCSVEGGEYVVGETSKRKAKFCYCHKRIKQERKKTAWDGHIKPKGLYFQLCDYHTIKANDGTTVPAFLGQESVMHHIWMKLREIDLAKCMAVCREWGRAIPHWRHSMARRCWYAHYNPGTGRGRGIRMPYTYVVSSDDDTDSSQDFYSEDEGEK